MKIRFAMLCVVLLSSVYMAAQSDFNIGFTVGGGFGNFRGDNVPDEFDSQLSTVFGVEVQKALGDNIYLRSGLFYGKKEVEFETFIPLSDFDIIQSTMQSVNISAITVPVYFGYRSTGDFRFHANAGPFISFITDEENIITKSLDYGIGASLGIEYALTNKSILRFEILNELGLSDINDSRIDIEGDAIMTNRLGAYLTYLIQL